MGVHGDTKNPFLFFFLRMVSLLHKSNLKITCSYLGSICNWPILGHALRHHTVDAGPNWVFGSGSKLLSLVQFSLAVTVKGSTNTKQTEIQEETKDLNCERAGYKILPFPVPFLMCSPSHSSLFPVPIPACTAEK